MNRDNIKALWEYVQDLLDISGDCWMGFLTLVFIIRVAAVLKGYAAITPSETALYTGAIGAFAYSNKGPRV